MIVEKRPINHPDYGGKGGISMIGTISLANCWSDLASMIYLHREFLRNKNRRVSSLAPCPLRLATSPLLEAKISALCLPTNTIGMATQ